MTEDTSTASDPNVTGVLDINEKGFGFLRKAKNNYLAGDDDVFVAPDMIRQNKLVAGLTLEGSREMDRQCQGQKPLCAVKRSDLSQWRTTQRFRRLQTVY